MNIALHRLLKGSERKTGQPCPILFYTLIEEHNMRFNSLGKQNLSVASVPKFSQCGKCKYDIVSLS